MRVIDKHNFEEAINGPTPVLVDFWNTACLSCWQAVPALKQLEIAYRDRILIAKYNVDTDIGIIERFNINKVPYFIFFKDGGPKFTVEGFKNIMDLEKKIREFL